MRLNRANERRGIILLVVLSLLTLFAIVGITFVLYADSEAAAARIARESETRQRADVDPEYALAYFLNQLIYDVYDDDATSVGSGLRGHSLARNIYGYNPNATGGSFGHLANGIPFGGVGRLHYPGPPQLPPNTDDYNLVNYTWFSGDKFLRDPERVGTRTSPTDPPNPYVSGNAPYTYPDLNNFFLAAVKADGTVLVPSFHRPWLFNPGKAFNDRSDPNGPWFDAVGKYLTVRPRPNEHPHFPYPDDATGDVKNLVGAPGGNDSIWIDIGAPVMTAPDGTQYKMLVAPLIVDLDGRINLNTAGNILGQGNGHVSNQGWGPWEVNLAKVLNNTGQTDTTPPTDYANLFQGKTVGGATVRGKYVPGTPPTPSAAYTTPPTGTTTPTVNVPHFYAPVDFNGVNEAVTPLGSAPSSRPVPPAVGATATTCFPTFLQGYLNGGTTENTNHPLLYNFFPLAFNNTANNRVFRASEMESLLRTNSIQYPVDAGSSALISELFQLCSNSFGPNVANSKYRNLVTTLSMDLGKSGVIPYWYSPQNGTNPQPYLFQSQPTNPYPAPVGNAVPFPTVTSGQNISNNAPSTSLNPSSEFDSNWRAVSAGLPSLLGRISLNRPLPPYPHMGQKQTPPYGVALVTYGTAYDLTNTNIQNQLNWAIGARQGLANDIYRQLVVITGVGLPANPAAPDPTDPNLATRRWLAQLAVNIVDFIDEDDISTPFNFYNTTDGLTAAKIGATQGNDDPDMNAQNQSGSNNTGANPIYWVFGTELPKVVLNEVLAEAQDPDPTKAAVDGESVKVWLELFNTMQSPVAAGTQAQDAFRVPLYMTLPGGAAGTGYSPYRITIAQTPMLTGAAPLLPDATSNVLGKANLVAPFPQSTTDADFATAANVKLMGGGAQPANSNSSNVSVGIDPQGAQSTSSLPAPLSQFFLIGPGDSTAPLTPVASPYQDPFAAAGANPGVPTNTPILRSPNLTYTPTWTGASTTDERTTGLTVMLRRLANPYLSFNPFPLLPNGDPNPLYDPNMPTNPYVTIDYLQNVPIRSNTPAAPYKSRGKMQPYAALTLTGANAANSPVVDQTSTQVVSNVSSTFGNLNTPLPPSGHYDWLVHLDRQPISPMELLHVSGYQPYQLTQRFMLGPDSAAANMFGHYVPWFDAPPPGQTTANMSTPWWFDANLTAGQSHRLYRLFEFLESGDRAYGVNTNGSRAALRIPGKININTIWDAEIFRAICDANTAIGIPDDTIINTIFTNLLNSRSPNFLANNAVGPVNIAAGSVPTGYQLDRPFLPLSLGLSPAGQLGQPGQQYPNGASIQDTILRSSPTAAPLFLLQNPNDTSAMHPYLQTQLLTKIYNNLTTRSNVFAVWVTVGFFEVERDAAGNMLTAVGASNLPRLGAEIGRSEGRHIRHRMFAIVDRTNLGGGGDIFPFGNPGPQPATFDPRQNPYVIPYYSIID